MNLKYIKASIFALIIIILQSCAVSNSIPLETSENAKTQSPPDGKALVYIYRTSMLGFAVGLNVSINDKSIASLYPKKFYVCTLNPGKYVFTGKSENEEDLILTIKPNQKYYIEVTPQMGNLYAQVELNIHDEVDGRKGVQKCKMIGSSTDIQAITEKVK